MPGDTFTINLMDKVSVQGPELSPLYRGADCRSHISALDS